MNADQRMLMELLSQGIKNKGDYNLFPDITDWEGIFYEAKKHDVHTILYPVYKQCFGNKGENTFSKEWARAVIVEGAAQIQIAAAFAELINAFNGEGVETIALKGIVIKELYPSPELRTMADIDLLIHKQDFTEAAALLMEKGYINEGTNEKHTTFRLNENVAVELHTALFNEKHSSSLSDFEAAVWCNTMAYEVHGQALLVLNLECQLTYLCVHLAEHFKTGGFGLRQLCDIVVFVDRYYDEIDWKLFAERIGNLGISRFTHAMFLICNKYFDMKLPFDIKDSDIADSDIADFHNAGYDFSSQKLIDAFLEDILRGGIYGKSTDERQQSANVLKFMRNSGNLKKKTSFMYFLNLLFPSADSLCSRYGYCRKFRILLPAAWVHRLVFGLVRKDFPLKQKAAFLLHPPLLSELDVRISLIQRLGL